MSGIHSLLNVQNSYDVFSTCFNSVHQSALVKVNYKPFTLDPLVFVVGKLLLYKDFCILFKEILCTIGE